LAAGAVAKGNGEGGAELQRQVFVATVAFGRRDGNKAWVAFLDSASHRLP